MRTHALQRLSRACALTILLLNCSTRFVLAADLAAEKSPPLHISLAPLMAPASFIAPGISEHIRDGKAPVHTYLGAGLAALTFLGSAAVLAASGASDGTTIPFVPLVYLGATSWTALAVTDLISGFSNGPSPGTEALLSFVEHTEKNAESGLFGWTHHGRTYVSGLYRAVEDEAFDTSAYLETVFGFDSPKFSGHAAYDRSVQQDIDIYEISLAYRPFGLFLQNGMHVSQPNETVATVLERARGFGLKVVYEREENAPGFFDKNSWTLFLHGAMPLSILSARLRSVWFEQNVGFSQIFLKYRGPLPETASRDSVSAFAGHMRLNWWAWNDLAFGFGYEHGRDSTSSPVSGGFTGHFYASSELRFGKDWSLGALLHQGTQQILDLMAGVDL